MRAIMRYMDATAHINGGQDIRFKMYYVDKNGWNDGQMDRETLWTFHFGNVLSWPIQGVIYAGTNCPGFQFADGNIMDSRAVHPS